MKNKDKHSEIKTLLIVVLIILGIKSLEHRNIKKISLCQGNS